MLKRAIRRSELKRGCRQQFSDYLSGQGPYGELINNISQGPAQGHLHAPGIKLVINASIDTLSLPEVATRLPAEINDRRARAGECISGVVKLMLGRHYRPKFAEAQRTLFEGWAAKEDFAYLAKYWFKGPAMAGVNDVSMVGGGAVRALQKAGIGEEDEPYTAILARSPGLQTVAKTDQRNYKKLKELMGLPYAKSEHYTIISGEGGLCLDFVQATQDALHALREGPDGGCPARRIPSPFSEGVNLLADTWNQLAVYLIPPEATVLDNS